MSTLMRFMLTLIRDTMKYNFGDEGGASITFPNVLRLTILQCTSGQS